MKEPKELLGTMGSPYPGDLKTDGSAVEAPLLGPTSAFPMPTWTRAHTDKQGRRLPQTIAHRGYKAKHPENTMGAFVGAVEAGAHAIETDIHLSSDGVVVLSHDATLERCFGEKDKIIDHDWNYLSTLRTLKEPHEPMPRLLDLLRYLNSPDLEDTWLLLDIKLDNDPDTVMRLIAETINAVPASTKPWNERVVLGFWAARFLPLCQHHLPGFPLTYICFSTFLASRYFSVPNVSFNILQKSLMGPIGSSFLRRAKKLNRPVFVWTVDKESLMRWSIRKEVDGVITDDPKKFLDVCDKWKRGDRGARVDWIELLDAVRLNIYVLFFIVMFWWKFGEAVDRRWTRRAIEDQR